MDNLFSSSSVVDSNRILYTASTFARSSLLHLQEIGSLKAIKEHSSRRSDLPSYLFFIVVSGSGVLNYNGKEYSLSTSSCVFIDCRKPYSHSTNPDDMWTLQWIHFDGPEMNAIYSKYQERGGRAVFSPQDAVSDQIEIVWQSLFDVAGSADYMRDMLINQHLSTLLTLLMSESWHPEDQKHGKKRESLLDVKKWIDQNYDQKITLESLSSRFFINKYYLSKSFKEQFGQSLSSYILSIRITKAKQLLRFTDKSVEEIGLECGLGAAHYFSQTFKNVEGVPPSKYREQW